MKKCIPFGLLVLAMLSCENKAKNVVKDKNTVQKATVIAEKSIQGPAIDTILMSEKHHPNSITCDLDGDNLSDTVLIVQNIKNAKYGLKISYGSQEVDFLGMGKEIAGQGFDDIEWVGVFEVAPKGEIYYNNVDEDGTILTEEDVKEADKIKLQNDGIFIHQAESCGGGILYLKNGKFEWIQQE